MSDYNQFGNTLREIRKCKGLSQENMASMLNISRSGYSKYESGESSPSIDTIKEICEILNISSDYLIGIKNDDVMNKETIRNNPFNVSELYMYFNAYSKKDDSFALGEFKLVFHDLEDKCIVDFCDTNNKIYERGFIHSDNAVAILVLENYKPNNTRLNVSQIVINISEGVQNVYFGTYSSTNGEYIPCIRKCIFATKPLNNKSTIIDLLKVADSEKKKLKQTDALYLNIFNLEYTE